VHIVTTHKGTDFDALASVVFPWWMKVKSSAFSAAPMLWGISMACVPLAIVWPSGVNKIFFALTRLKMQDGPKSAKRLTLNRKPGTL